MVNLEEIKGEHKKLYITPQLVIEYLDVDDIITTSQQEAVIDEKTESADNDGFEDD